MSKKKTALPAHEVANNRVSFRPLSRLLGKVRALRYCGM
jgi:hypothetical protein